MVKKVSDNPIEYKSDDPAADFGRFEDAMRELVKPKSSDNSPLQSSVDDLRGRLENAYASGRQMRNEARASFGSTDHPD